MRQPFTLAHLSDTHLGFTQYPVAAPSGRPQREQDFVRAFAQVVEDIAAWDPNLVIHSGDFFDKPTVSTRHQKQGQDGLVRLSRRPDGTYRVTIVISGNHDQPLDPREPCALELDRPLPGVRIVTSRYEVVDLGELVDAGVADECLRNVLVHCLPHDVLKELDFSEVVPVPGKTNILVSHCVVGGSVLYKRSLGREFALPIDVVTRGWDYVALGHWHKRGPVAVGGYTTATTPIWYAGSTENNGMSDVTVDGSGRGYLQCTFEAEEKLPRIVGVDLPIRAMFKLPTIDATGMDDAQILDAMKRNIAESDIAGAVVVQRIENVPADVWALVDIDAARQAASRALWWEFQTDFTTPAGTDGDAPEQDRLADLGAVLADVAAQLYADDGDLDDVMALSRKLLGDALDAPEEGADTCCGTDDSALTGAEDDSAGPDTTLQSAAQPDQLGRTERAA